MAPGSVVGQSHCRAPRRSSSEALRAHGASLSSLLASAPPWQKPKERTVSGPVETPSDRRLPGRHHPGTAGEIILERRATSNRIGGRHHSGFAGEFTRNQQLITSFRYW